MCGLIHYKHGMVIIGPLDKSVQRIYQRNDFQNVFLLSLSCQTIQLFNEYGVYIINRYKGSDKKKFFEYITTKENQ